MYVIEGKIINFALSAYDALTKIKIVTPLWHPLPMELKILLMPYVSTCPDNDT